MSPLERRVLRGTSFPLMARPTHRCADFPYAPSRQSPRASHPRGNLDLALGSEA